MKEAQDTYNRPTMSDLNVSFAGLPLRYPILVESTSPVISTPVVQRISDAPIGAIRMPPFVPATPNSVTGTPIGEYGPSNRGEAADRDVDSILRHLDIDSYLDTLGGVCSVSSVPVIGALSVYRRRQAVSYAQMMMDAGAAAVEIRPFDHLAIRASRSDQIEKNVLRIAAAVADRVEVPIIMRVPATAYGLGAFVDALGGSGIAGVILESFDDLAIVNTDRMTIEADPSAPEMMASRFHMMLAATRRLYRRVTPHLAVPIPATRARATVEAILSGATAVILPLSLEDMQKSLAAVSTHVRNLQGWMGSRRHDSLFDVRGHLSESRRTSSLERN